MDNLDYVFDRVRDTERLMGFQEGVVESNNLRDGWKPIRLGVWDSFEDPSSRNKGTENDVYKSATDVISEIKFIDENYSIQGIDILEDEEDSFRISLNVYEIGDDIVYKGPVEKEVYEEMTSEDESKDSWDELVENSRSGFFSRFI